MNFYIGTMFQDLNENIYQIRDVNYGNSHSQHPGTYLCSCLEGHNKGREMWVMRSTLVKTELKEVFA